MLACGQECYNVEERCDGKSDCTDGTDEKVSSRAFSMQMKKTGLQDCDECDAGSRQCGDRVICIDDPCPEDDDEGDSFSAAALEDVSEEECGEKCDHFWCNREGRCIHRNDRLQGCSDLSGFPSVDAAIFTNVSGPACDSGIWGDRSKESTDVDGRGERNQVFKQASCVPDTDGLCPTSIVMPDEEDEETNYAFNKAASERGRVKLWLKCGSACWHKTVRFGPGELPARYVNGRQCPREDFAELCAGHCKFYDAWFCDGDLICTDRPCRGRCQGQDDDLLPPESRFEEGQAEGRGGGGENI